MQHRPKSLLRFSPFLCVHRYASRDGRDARVRNRANIIMLDRLLVLDPLVLDDVLLFQVRDNDCEGYPVPTQNIEEQLVGSLRRCSDPSPGC